MILEISITHVTKKQKTFIDGELSADLWLIDGFASLQAKLRKLHEETRFSYRLYRRGPILPIETDIEKLMEQVQNFPVDVAQQPWDVSFEVLPYSVLLGSQPSDLWQERQYVRELSDRRNHWADIADRLDSVVQDRWQFDKTVGLFRLRRSIALARAHADELDQTFHECVAGLPDDCQTGEPPVEPQVVDVPGRILVDTLFVNGGTPAWCLSAVSTKPHAGCNVQKIGYTVEKGPWALTELFEADQPTTGAPALWTENKGPSVGSTMRRRLGTALYACPSGRVLGKRGGVCGPSERARELVGYSFSPREQ